MLLSSSKNETEIYYLLTGVLEILYETMKKINK